MPSNKKIIQGLIIISIISFGGFKLFRFLKKKTAEPVVKTETFVKKDSTISATLLSEFFDLESFKGPEFSTEKASSGKQSYKLSGGVEYGFGVIKPVKDIPSGEGIKSIDITLKCRTNKTISDAVYVLAIDDTTGKNIFWEGKPIDCSTGSWNTLHFSYDLKSGSIKPEYIIKLYPWNKAKEEFFIDDISVHYNGMVVINDAHSKNSNTNFFFDFETTDGITNTDNIRPTTAHSGKVACELKGGIEYGPSVIKTISEVSNAPLKKISMSAWLYPLADNPNTVLTVSVVNSKNETVFWEGKSTEKQSFPKNTWTKINAAYNLPAEKLSPDDKIQINIWNKGKTDIIADDLEIVYGEQPERRGLPSTIDPNMFYNKHFTPQKNKPPFKTIYFEKLEINNNNSTFITADNKNNLADFSPNDEFLVGNFIPDKHNLDAIICIKESKAGLFSYSPKDKQFQIVWENATADPAWNTDKQNYAGDFNNDGKWDILKINKSTNDWEIIDFDGEQWNSMLKGNEKTLNPNWIRKNKKLPPAGTDLFKPSDLIFPGNYRGGPNEELLKLNLDWRFDLKLIEQDKNTYTILGTVDFKGYPNDYNPKYYEFIKIVPGKFISPVQSSLLIMMRNCMDGNFDGTHCEQFESLPYLPNSTELYNLGNK